VASFLGALQTTYDQQGEIISISSSRRFSVYSSTWYSGTRYSEYRTGISGVQSIRVLRSTPCIMYGVWLVWINRTGRRFVSCDSPRLEYIMSTPSILFAFSKVTTSSRFYSPHASRMLTTAIVIHSISFFTIVLCSHQSCLPAKAKSLRFGPPSNTVSSGAIHSTRYKAFLKQYA
jgi:hypothetical protein